MLEPFFLKLLGFRIEISQNLCDISIIAFSVLLLSELILLFEMSVWHTFIRQ